MNDEHPKVTPTVSLLEDLGASRRKKAKARLALLGLVIVVGGFGFWYFENHFALHLEDVASFGSSLENSLVSSIADNISTPPPLRAPVKKVAAVKQPAATGLTKEGVITDTNAERATNGALPALQENATLDSIASLRLDDMFDKQYFAHVAPNGSSATTTAVTVGYSYLALGENLALGGFTSDKDIVDAWMASPGHRANILNNHYTEIGVAVRKGTFQGSSVWIGVQIFGKPSSDCPAPDATLKANITTADGNLTAMNNTLQTEKADIDATEPKSGQAYNDKVSQYNALVAQYNDLANQTKTAIAQYNAEAAAFNACLGT